MGRQRIKFTLAIIVVAQFFCTSVWFAANAVLENITPEADVETLGHFTSAVQLGFISGTLVYALLSVSDLFSPSKVFLISAVLAGSSNLLLIVPNLHFTEIILLRLLTGFFLAGIYPVGLKIATDHYDRNLGKSLGLLIGALVLGTAFPHLLRLFTGNIYWQSIVIITSLLALSGGLLVYLFIPDGPYRKEGQKVKLSRAFFIFKELHFRKVALAYFGHNWELYALWAFIPVILKNYNKTHQAQDINTNLFSFLIISFGSIGCVVNGLISAHFKPQKTALFFVSFSFICCVCSPLIFFAEQPLALISFLLIWSFVAVADSPSFSTLIARNVPTESKGTALTMVNCIGFAITICSIQLLSFLFSNFDIKFIFCVLCVGPLVSILSLRSIKTKDLPETVNHSLVVTDSQ